MLLFSTACWSYFPSVIPLFGASSSFLKPLTVFSRPLSGKCSRHSDVGAHGEAHDVGAPGEVIGSGPTPPSLDTFTGFVKETCSCCVTNNSKSSSHFSEWSDIISRRTK
ncbi:hypothetical protein EYF80_060891 [Liparis tanakae]|uniref:Uncharacterized protein n=1 Tax=Liparis tanakae TaxID=230148 RepID=A0A4Z2EJZ5_9TELE|nr:hypothetical protein EYF80_060891 [Liparis tanakae]